MTIKQRIFMYFFAAGFLGGLAGTGFLWYALGSDNSYLILGFRERWIFYAFPFVGALLSGFWAVSLLVPDFGAVRGAAASLLAFLTFNLVLVLLGPAGFNGGFIAGINGLLSVVFGYTLFGFIMFGWALVVIGVITGWLFKRSVEKHSNNAFNPDAQNPHAG